MKFQTCVDEVRATLLESNESGEDSPSGDLLPALGCAPDVVADE